MRILVVLYDPGFSLAVPGASASGMRLSVPHRCRPDRVARRGDGGSWSVIIDSGFDEDQARHPNGVEIGPDGNLIVADHDGIGGRSRIRRFTTDGDFIERIGSSDDDEGDVWRPMHMTVSACGDLFVAARMAEVNPLSEPLPPQAIRVLRRLTG